MKYWKVMTRMYFKAKWCFFCCFHNILRKAALFLWSVSVKQFKLKCKKIKIKNEGFK